MNNDEQLVSIAEKLVESGKGILAGDESTSTIKKRFDVIDLESTEESRKAYREMLFSANGIEQFISGVILYEETLKQKTSSGIGMTKLLDSKGIIPGIKVDAGTVAMEMSPHEVVTEGLKDLPERLVEYKKYGAQFAKWRAVIKIGDGLPTQQNIEESAKRLAKYAKYCQEAGIVPIVEPEVIMDGGHSAQRCEDVTSQVLKAVFKELEVEQVLLPGMLLKPNMILSGASAETQSTDEQIAEATVRVLLENVPKEVAGVVFLSGGQSAQQATNTLNLISQMNNDLPWPVTFSYGRALQNEALETWHGKSENVERAQKKFMSRAKLTSLASLGKYNSEMELGL